MSKHAKASVKPSSSKGGPKGKSKGPPFRLLDHENPMIYEFLTSNKEKIESTKFLNRESFEALGVLKLVEALFDNIRWGQFLHNRATTYIEPTLEFLSTFKPYDKSRVVTFKMLGGNRTFPYRVVNALMGTPVDHTYSHQDPWSEAFNEYHFWQKITHEPWYSSSSSKASSIIHPCLRLAY
ncbi:unnamed protein product [Lactuca saligna]|uniref:Arabidopsis retrotransposon Orf1 C-terminal domain-containing protein n=1 Tax=Lactuca saligna TaxID=75948 RepID=A0AA36DZM9_LACSI|nr:unnamed protein product [Lactuca saligna]